MSDLAEIGVFGGSGLYSLMTGVKEHVIETPYGAPSAPLAVGEIEGRKVAFLPRHGKHHEHPANAVNYRANVYAMKSIGVKSILAPCSCGSLQSEVRPGDFVLIDQFVDRTSGREDTYYKGPITTHVGMADPYCAGLRNLAEGALKELGYAYHNSGTMVVIQGPRFSTRAESKWFSSNGWSIVGMTQYPEVALARELEMCYMAVAPVTDYDVGLSEAPGIEPVTMEEVLRVFKSNVERVQKLIFKLVPQMPTEPADCDCRTALARARFV